jgi:hypothetical protein
MSHLINMPRCRAAWIRIVSQANATDTDLGKHFSEEEVTALECQAIVYGRRLAIIRTEPTLVVHLM